jgi:cyclopropane fatty-acyl-phospholipid synthase-like methyltransferase
MGMFNNAMIYAPEIAEIIDLTGKKRLLDLGGGPGTYAVHFCKKYPDLHAIVYDLPTTRPYAKKVIERFSLSDRIEFMPGDYTSEELKGAYDAVWLSHILHGESPQTCERLVENAVSVLNPGGLVVIHEFILDDTLDHPVFPALFSLNMLLGTSGGKAYSQSELTRMLYRAGAKNIRRLPYRSPTDSGLISGEV